MRKIILITLIMFVGFLAACGEDENTQINSNAITSTTDTSQSEEVAEGHVRITVSINEGEEHITEKEIAIEDGDILIDVMEENFYIETAYDGAFITSIERVAASDEEKTSWMFFVNDEMPTVGVAEYELSSGDKIVFDLQPWE